MTAPRLRELPWRDPSDLAHALAARLGPGGLVLLQGDGGAMGKRAVLGVDPLETVCCRGLPGDPGASDPFGMLRRMGAQGGAWLGWLAYEAGAWLEPSVPWRSPDMAVLWAARHDPLIHFDLVEHRCWLAGEDPGRLEDLATLIAALAPTGDRPGMAPIPLDAWHWHTSPARYARQVGQLLQWIAAGDIFQANLTACCQSDRPQPPDPLALWERLRGSCPAPFAGVAIGSGEARGEALISASPERFLRLSPEGMVETRPIKGTRPRHADAQQDAAAAADLITDPKDRAENVMIVDLLRNDLGRVCQPGTISVPQLVGLESYPQVHHLTSVVSGRLRPEHDVVDLLRACWPGGSISGAPKLRACTRLHALEPVPRGPYCGSLFHWGADGSFDSSILIRTLMVRGQRLRLHAGGGIVADSDPQAEAEEMGWKIRPLLEALA